jgi:hypothetical protein
LRASLLVAMGALSSVVIAERVAMVERDHGGASAAAVSIHNNVMSHVVGHQHEQQHVHAHSEASLVNLEGVELSPSRIVNGRTLQLHGFGTRSIRLMGMNFKVYVAGLYTAKRIATEDHLMLEDHDEDDHYMHFDFTFLRSVGQSKVTQAWQQQLEHSVTYVYDGYEQDRDAFIAMFGPISNGGTESVQLIGSDTIVIDQGQVKGRIPGRNFQRSFLSVWFGEKAVCQDLKAGLLGKGLMAETLPPMVSTMA